MYSELGRIMISPSLISMDHCNLEREVRALEEQNIDLLHIDIIDGHFSPSLPLGLDTVRQLRSLTDIPFDVHLMATNQTYFIDELLDIGVWQIVFHAESEPHIDHQLNRISQAGVRAGLALKPSTPLHMLDYVIEKCDTVLLMLINPGFANVKSEKQVPYADRKIRELHHMIHSRGLATEVEIDGRVSLDDIRRYGGREVNIFVAGSTCINRNRISDSFVVIRKTVEERKNEFYAE